MTTQPAGSDKLPIAERHRDLASRFNGVITLVTDWNAPTPVKEWTARDIIGHMLWIRWVLEAPELNFAPLEVDESNPGATFLAHTDEIQALLEDPGKREIVVPNEHFGGATVEQVVEQYYLPDLIMHSWDLAMSQGLSNPIDEGTALTMAEGMEPQAEMLGGSGQFGTPVVLEEDAPAIDRLVSVIGRDPHWRRPNK